MKTEYALYIEPWQMSLVNKIPEKISAIYLGSDVCEHKIPGIEDIKKATAMSEKIIIPIPPATDIVLDRFSTLTEAALKVVRHLEITVNDIGAMYFFRTRFGNSIKLNIGRILFFIWSKNTLEYNQQIFQENKINSFETDEVDTANSCLASRRFDIAFHYPYLLYSLTRMCVYSKGIKSKCDFECGHDIIRLGETDILWHGNAYYRKISKMPSKKPSRIIVPHYLLANPSIKQVG